MAFAGRLSSEDRRRLFEAGDVYRVRMDEERAARAPVRVAILGGGGVAQAKYLPSLALLASRWEPVSVAGVLTPEEDQAAKITRAFGISTYQQLDDLLAEEQPDAAVVTASDGAHRELAEAALAAGLHVLVEKPMAPTAADARAIVDAAERAGRIAATVCNKRYSPPYRTAHEWLCDGQIGTPRLVTAKFTLGYGYVDLLRGGTIHMLDLLRFFLGDVYELAAAAGSGPGTNLAIALTFKSGAVATLATSSTALSLHPWERLEIFGDGAWFEVDDQARATLHPSEFAPTQCYQPVVPSTLVSDLEWGGYVPMIEDFLDAVRIGAPMLTTADDGARALDLVEVIEQSAAAGGERLRVPAR